MWLLLDVGEFIVFDEIECRVIGLFEIRFINVNK